MFHFRIHDLQETEIPKIRDFFERNPNDHVMMRPDQAIQASIDASCLFAAELVPTSGSPSWVGVSGVYALDCDGLKLREAGGSLAQEAYQGFGIHKVFHLVRSVTNYIMDKSYDHYFGAIIAPNDRSKSNLNSMGFQPWTNAPTTLVADRQKYAAAPHWIEFYQLPRKELQNHATLLLEYVNSGTTEGKSGTATIEIRTLVVAQYTRAIQELANGNFN